MISDFIKSEHDLSDTEVLDKLIYETLIKLFWSYGEIHDDDCALNSDYWELWALDELELSCKSTIPLKLLSQINTETYKVANRVNLPFHYMAVYKLSDQQIKEAGHGQLHTYKDRPLYNLNGQYSLVCAVLALRILIPMWESSTINATELVTATKLIQAIPQCELLCAISKQVLAERIRHYDPDNIDNRNKIFDENPINAFKKNIVQSKTIGCLIDNESLSIQDLTKKVNVLYDTEINNLMYKGEVPEANADYDIRDTTRDRWIEEAKAIYDNSDD